MRKRILGTLLCLCMIMALMPMRAKAALTATNITVTDATYYESGAVKSVTTKFGWNQDNGPKGRLVLMTERLRSAGEEGTTTNYGDFSNSGYYANSFKTFDEVLAYDTAEGTFGIVNYTEEAAVNYGSDTNTWNFSFENTDITLSKNQTYYVYFWTNYGEQYYPDNLFLVFQVENGALRYAVATDATDRNTYGSFSDVVSQLKYNVEITPAANMTKTNESGAETQNDLTTAMEPVVYTANDGYYFPEDYAVATVNGIMVKRDSETQITVYGTPSNNAEITLTAPTQEMKALEEITFGYAYDVQRNPAFPVKDGTIKLYGLDKPLVGDRFEQKDTNEGSWTLTKAGTYSYMKNTGTGNASLSNIVDDVARNYNKTGNEKEGIVIHELKDGDTHIAYGVVIVFDEVNGYAAFVGDNISGSGAGYLLSRTALSGEITANAAMIATDFVPTINYSIILDPSTTITFDAKTEGEMPPEGKEIKVINIGNGETGELVVSLSGINAGSFGLSNTTLPSIKVNDNVDEEHIYKFTVSPKENLPIGTHTATIHVSGRNIVSQTVDVTFTVNEAPHVCTLTPVTKVEATCTTPGKELYYHCNACGKDYEDAQGTKEISDITVWGNISELGHDWAAANCTAPKTCKRDNCGVTEGTALGHTASAWKYDTDNHWKECTVEGCGVKLDSATHEFEWKTDKEATETENGSKHEECIVCGYKKAAVDIPATGTDVEEEEPEEEETTQIVETPATPQPPQTGDNNMTERWIFLIFISSVSIVTMTTINRKRNSVK